MVSHLFVWITENVDRRARPVGWLAWGIHLVDQRKTQRRGGKYIIIKQSLVCNRLAHFVIIFGVKMIFQFKITFSLTRFWYLNYFYSKIRAVIAKLKCI